MAKYFISLALTWDNGTINARHPHLLPRASVGSFLASEQGAESFRALSSNSNNQARKVPFVLCCLAYNHAQWAPLLFSPHWYWIWLPIMLHGMGLLCITVWLWRLVKRYRGIAAQLWAPVRWLEEGKWWEEKAEYITPNLGKMKPEVLGSSSYQLASTRSSQIK